LYKLLFRQLIAFATDRGISLANNIDLDALTKFRATWKLEPLTALKTLERLRSIYKFAVKRKMVSENYALDLVPPEVEENPTLPFPEEEMLRIIKASVSDKADRRINAFILTMRYSGLRISDVSTLSTDSLEGNRLRLHQTKTGVFVSVLIPPDVAEALRAVRHKNPKYFFWSGTSEGFIDHRFLEKKAGCRLQTGWDQEWDQEWPQSQIP
jgi:site-specific recombinase XerC